MKAYRPVFVSLLHAVAIFVAAQSCFGQNENSWTVTPIAAAAPTLVPALVPYSGVAMGGDGRPKSGEISVTFLIFKEEQGSEALFAETQSVVADPAGHFTAQLGASLPNGIPISLFGTGEARWLEVQVAGEAAQPRSLLASVAYALKAADASTLGGLPASAFALAMAKSPTVVPAIAPDATTGVTTTGGVSGYLAQFSGVSSIVDSPVFVLGTDVGIGTAAPTATLDVNGAALVSGALTASGMTANGTLELGPLGTASASAGYGSQLFKIYTSAYNSSSKAVVAPHFEWAALVHSNDTASPTATLNLLSSNTSSGATETGFSFNANGVMSFAPGQTFPGAGTITGITAGTGLVGGGTSGTVPLSINTAIVPELGTANTFTANQTVNGSVTATSFAGSGAGLTGVVASNSAELGGLAPTSYAQLTASNSFTATQSFSKIGIGTATPRSLLEGQAAASKALGPVFTLTNTLGGLGAESALDFNTLLPSPSGTYNPMVRIAAIDANGFSDNLVFQSNTPGAQNNGLQTNMIVLSNGQVGVNTNAPGAQLEVDANPSLGTDAIYGFGATSLSGAGTIGVKGTGGADSGSIGVQGFGGSAIASSPAGAGAIFTGGYAEGTGSGGDGVDASAGGSADTNAPAGYAGYFGGDVSVTGTLTAGAKNFEIDHPLDPANKYLDHASVESSEMVNIYSGNVTTDELGVAIVKLPEWFEAVNTDFRYQLTVVGKFAQAIISQEIANHQFKISTNATFTKVSWQVTGVRHDAFATAHPLLVERQKPPAERGFYAHPELYGQPAEKQTQWGRHPETMRKMQAFQTQRKTLAEVATP